jgi:REP element-mobilizing transposase RayT
MFFAILRRVLGRLWWACHSYCLMTNHFHLLIETQDESLSAGMQRLNGEYAQSFNRRHGSVGHLFQDRFFSVMVEDEAHGLEVIRYIANNPVEAGLCREPEDWRWSSHAAALGRRRAPDFLTSSWVLGQRSPARDCGSSCVIETPYGVRPCKDAETRRANWLTPTPATVRPPSASPTRFVVVHVRQTLQHAGTAGPYSAARFAIGARRTDTRSSTLSL